MLVLLPLESGGCSRSGKRAARHPSRMSVYCSGMNSSKEPNSAVDPQLDALEDVQKKIDELQAQRDAVREEIRNNMVEAVVVFLDMVGSTDFKVRHLQEPWVWILRVRQFTEVVTEYIERLRGQVAKYIGDEVMAVFRGKDALDDAMSLVARVKNIEGDLTNVTATPMRIKVALDKGPVYLLKFEGHDVLDPQGSSVDRCARIAKFAEPGIVLASGDVARDSGDAYKWELAGEVPVKGLGSISIYQLGKATLRIRERVEVVKAEYEELLQRTEAQANRLAELQNQKQKLVEMNRTLQNEIRKSGATPSAENSMEEQTEEDETYERLVDAAQKALRPLSAVVIEAFFYEYYGEPFRPEGFDDVKWIGIREALEYHSLEEVDGGFAPNENDKKVLTAAEKLKALHRFLECDSSPEFHGRFSEDHDSSADLTNRTFWEGQLGL